MTKAAKYVALARYLANLLSKDPSTKCGAVITRPDHTIASVGVNGFPKGCDDSPHLFAERQLKYPRVIHAEQNAIVLSREPLHGYSIHVWPASSSVCTCADCAKLIIQAGIRRVVYAHSPDSSFSGRWGDSCAHAAQMYSEVGVEVVPVPLEELPQ